MIKLTNNLYLSQTDIQNFKFFTWSEINIAHILNFNISLSIEHYSEMLGAVITIALYE